MSTTKHLEILYFASLAESAGKDEDLVTEHGPQLASYERALLGATGKPVLQKWLYLPVAGRAVRLTFVDG